ncbi:MAG: extracellular solute-binding protein [Chthoniobacteraceae bacterium]
MTRQLPLLLALVAVLIGPILLRPKQADSAHAGAQSLVIVTPHNESIRFEFGRAFEESYFAKTGQRVRVDWRTPGGTSEIARYVASEYLASFQNYWTNTLQRPWSKEVELSFDNAKVTPAPIASDDTLPQQARRAFLKSNIGAKIDLFFGGGAYDFEQQARAGRLVDAGFISAHPGLFNNHVIPQKVSGEPFWDPQGRWIGTVISSFGICYNTDALARLGIAPPPQRWADLADPRYFHNVALANPTQSGSVNKSFEMLIQQQMQEVVAGRTLLPDEEKAAVAEGWTRAQQLLMKIGANARYFTDSSTKIALDTEAGEAAAGMTIDFYGRFQSEAVRRPDGSSRLQYVNAAGGTSVGVDPIGLFRGAPNPELARDFIAFVLSPEGQKLWNWKVGAPGGPKRYALRRLPILPALYAPEFKPLRSDPDVEPYELAHTFLYHDQWTGSLFRPIAFIFRVMCIDTHEELTEAWSALARAGFPREAMAVFEDVRAVDYAAASGRIREALGGDKIKEVRLAKELADHFRAQYRRAAEMARNRGKLSQVGQ